MPVRLTKVGPPAKPATFIQAPRPPHAMVAICGLGISVLLFVGCLMLPAYTMAPGRPEVVYSYVELLIGWLGILYGIPEWLANPALLVAWGLILTRRYKAAMIAALCATLLAAGFLLREVIVASEAPTYASIVAYHWGYGLWVGSAIVACAASAVAMRQTSRPAST